MENRHYALARHELINALLGLECRDEVIPAGGVYHVSSGDVWAVLTLVVDGELRIDGEVHAWGDVTGTGTITGEGELRLH